MKGKKFINNNNNKIFEVVSIDGNIAQLNNGDKVAVERLMDNNFYTEDVASNFSSTSSTKAFQQALLKEANKVNLNDIKDNNAPSHDASDIKVEGVVESHDKAQADLKGHRVPDENEKKYNESFNPKSVANTEEELLKKYNLNNPNSDLEKQQEEFNKILKQEDKDIREKAQREYEKQYGDERGDTQNKENQKSNENIKTNNRLKTENPIYDVFRKAKKTRNISANIKIKKKLPNKDFMKMMEENYEGESIIEYFADEFYEELMKDPSIIKNQIIEEINKYVYNKKKGSN